MRFIRVASLVAGVVLLLTGIADVIGRRAELAESRDRALESAAALAAARTDAGIARIAAVLAIAPADTTVEQLAALLGAATCHVATDSDRTSCSVPAPTGPDDETVARAVQATTSRAAPAATIGTSSDGAIVVVVAVGDPVGVRYAVAPLADLLAPRDVLLRLVGDDGQTPTGARTVDDERVATVALATGFADGPRALQTYGAASVALSADERWLIGAQLLIGAGLAALAVGSFLVEHRALHRRATLDALTGLPNRAEFERRAGEALVRARRAGAGACVMLVDLDQFKAVNDTAGHHVGDRVLADAAGRLRSAVRESDVVGRWGGDEFVVLLDGVDDPELVGPRAEAIEAALAGRVPELADHPDGRLTASVGAALYPRHGTDLATLVRAADGAMYAAKAAGARHRLAAS